MSAKSNWGAERANPLLAHLWKAWLFGSSSCRCSYQPLKELKPNMIYMVWALGLTLSGLRVSILVINLLCYFLQVLPYRFWRQVVCCLKISHCYAFTGSWIAPHYLTNHYLSFSALHDTHLLTLFLISATCLSILSFLTLQYFTLGVPWAKSAYLDCFVEGMFADTSVIYALFSSFFLCLWLCELFTVLFSLVFWKISFLFVFSLW